jgi:FkbM family methyltransferase
MYAFRSRLRNWREAWRAIHTGTRWVTLYLRNGLVLRGGGRDDVVGIFNEIFVDRCYDPAWFYRPEPGHTVLDVGANIGIFSLYLDSVAPGIRVVAFEPHPETFDRLTENLAANRAGANIATRQVAVGRGHGEVRFSGASGLDSGHEAATSVGLGEAVECVGLADALEMAGDGPIDLLKVDTEGAEVEIIASAPPTVWPRIARAVVEYHDLGKRDQVVRALEGYGYRCRVEPAPGYEHHLGLIYAWRSRV